MLIENKKTGKKFFFDERKYQGVYTYKQGCVVYYLAAADGFRQVRKPSALFDRTREFLDVSVSQNTLKLIEVNNAMVIPVKNIHQEKDPDNLLFTILTVVFEDEVKYEEKHLYGDNEFIQNFMLDLNTEIGLKTMIEFSNCFPKLHFFETFFFLSWNDVIKKYPRIKAGQMQLNTLFMHLKAYETNEAYRALTDRGFGSIAFADGFYNSGRTYVFDDYALMEDFALCEYSTYDALSDAEKKFAAEYNFGFARPTIIKLMVQGFTLADINLFLEVFAGFTRRDYDAFKFIEAYLPNTLLKSGDKLRFIKRLMHTQHPTSQNKKIDSIEHSIQYFLQFASKEEVKKILEDNADIDKLTDMERKIFLDRERYRVARLKKVIDVDGRTENDFKKKCSISDEIDGAALRLITSFDDLPKECKRKLSSNSIVNDSDLFYTYYGEDNKQTSFVVRVSLEDNDVYCLGTTPVEKLSVLMQRIRNKYLSKFKAIWLNSKLEKQMMNLGNV